MMSEGYDKLILAHKLSEIDSKNDPEDEPFKSKYKAREILIEVKDKLKELLEEQNKPEQYRVFSAVLDLKLGINYVETEETHSGEESLNKCIDELEKYSCGKMGCNVFQTALNHLGILSCGQGDYPKALDRLEQAERLYHNFKRDVGGTPWSVEEFLKPPSDDKESLEVSRHSNFENTYTLSLYYMAQIFAKTGKTEKSALYCQVTLQRQLEYQQYDPVDWALNAATLSQYYITAEDFPKARHCLASASRIFEEAKSNGDESDETLAQRKADIDRCWIKYGLNLLEVSRDKLYKEVENMDLEEKENKRLNGSHNEENQQSEDGSAGESSTQSEECSDDMKHKMSTRFNLELTSLEDQITCEYLQVFSDAREVFLMVQKWITSAKEFYSLDNHCSDYIELVQDHSRAFKLLAFYEMDMDRQCKMHKRRIDMLTATLNELNPQFYLLVCRQLMYEIAETYSTMLDLKLAIMESTGGTPSSHAVNKINSLAQQSISQYQAYMDSLKGGKPELPEKFDDMDVRPALVAMFCMGRLYSKILTPQLPDRLANMQKSLDCYKFLVDYCKKNPDAEAIVKSEVSICAEMVELIPLKMAAAQRSGGS